MTTYSTGTIAIGASSTTVTGTGTAWLTSGIRAGDILLAGGAAVPIAAVVSNTQLTLTRAWPAAVSGAGYDILLLDDNVRSLVAINKLLQSLTNGTLTSLAALASAADKIPYFSGAGVMEMADLKPQARTLLGGGALSRDGADYTLNGALKGTAVTQSKNDTASGRLLKVGDYGLGGVAPNAPASISDAPGSLAPGAYNYSTSFSVGGPAAVVNGTLLHLSRAWGIYVQYMVGDWPSGAINQLYTRVYSSGAWSDWRRSYHEANILGSVGQSGGVPTGAVLETGNNVNGYYERRADGVLQCWITMPASASAAVTWTFPAVFIEAPSVHGTAQATVLAAVCLDAWPATTSVSLSVRDKTDARRADWMRVHAIGRWF